jgi:ferrochelatase
LPGSSRHRSDDLSRVGILLTNVGSPSAPSPSAVRAYLREFLGDPMVVDAPRLPWWLLLNMIILPLRSPRSARLYRSIWTDVGSPLIAISHRQADALTRELSSRTGEDVPVVTAMRYGEPSMASSVIRLVQSGCRRVLVLPLFPQYSRTTVGTTAAAVEEVLRRSRPAFEWRIMTTYPTHPPYIRALAASVRETWRDDHRGHLLMSFHGLPQRYADAGDPYPLECRRTAAELARELGLDSSQWTLCFQSRFGREPWLLPATDAVVLERAGRSPDGVDVLCPGFAADCLETLEEIAIRARESYEKAGGRRFRYIPALNDRPDHIAALADLVEDRLARWDEPQRAP